MQTHIGNRRPVTASTLVRARLLGGGEIVDRADAINWGPGLGDDGAGRVESFTVVCDAAVVLRCAPAGVPLAN